MFLKYPGSVRVKINKNLCIKGLCVIKEDETGELLYRVSDKLEIDDIKHKTELYTKYGKCKILKMNNRWYLYIMPSNTLIKRYRDRRYRDGFCEFIAEDCSFEELFVLYSDRLKIMEAEYTEYKINRLNERISMYLDGAYDSLKVISAVVDFDRNSSEIKYSHLTDENMKRLQNIFEAVDELKQVSQNP